MTPLLDLISAEAERHGVTLRVQGREYGPINGIMGQMRKVGRELMLRTVYVGDEPLSVLSILDRTVVVTDAEGNKILVPIRDAMVEEQDVCWKPVMRKHWNTTTARV